MNKQTVIGVFDTRNQASSAREALLAADVADRSIDVSNFGEHGRTGDNYHEESGKVESFFDRLFGDDDQDNNRDHRRSDAAREVASRGTVVTVHTESMENAQEAAAIMDRFGAIDFDQRYNEYQDDSFDADRNRNRLNERFGDVDGEQTLQVLKEDVAIGKREVRTGGISVRSHVIKRPIDETLRLRTEEVYVNRKKVDRPADNADFSDRSIQLQETSEEAVISKEARVKEEITIGKKVDSRSEKIHETARETEVDIKRTDGDVNQNNQNERV